MAIVRDVDIKWIDGALGPGLSTAVVRRPTRPKTWAHIVRVRFAWHDVSATLSPGGTLHRSSKGYVWWVGAGPSGTRNACSACTCRQLCCSPPQQDKKPGWRQRRRGDAADPESDPAPRNLWTNPRCQIGQPLARMQPNPSIERTFQGRFAAFGSLLCEAGWATRVPQFVVLLRAVNAGGRRTRVPMAAFRELRGLKGFSEVKGTLLQQRQRGGSFRLAAAARQSRQGHRRWPAGDPRRSCGVVVVVTSSSASSLGRRRR